MNKIPLPSRRSFISRSTCLTAATGIFSGQAFRAPAQNAAGRPPKFKLRYGPHPGMFKASAGDDVIDQIKFAANQGFTGHDRSKLENRDFVIGMEHGNSMPDKPGEEAVIQAYRDADAF